MKLKLIQQRTWDPSVLNPFSFTALHNFTLSFYSLVGSICAINKAVMIGTEIKTPGGEKKQMKELKKTKGNIKNRQHKLDLMCM